MVFTRRNLRQLGIRPHENTANLVRAATRIRPITRERSDSQSSGMARIYDALYNSDSDSQLSGNEVYSWFENLTPPQQERVRRR